MNLSATAPLPIPPNAARRTLPLERATAVNIAPFGAILGSATDRAALPIDFYGGAVTVRKPVDFVSDHTTELTVATVDRRAPQVRWMERHFKHTQTFIPLGGRPFIVVMAPPAQDRELPELDTVRAFHFDGSSGFTMHIGTWHEFPFALVDQTDIVVILRSETTRDLRRENVIADEAFGPDIEKRDLLTRAGMTFQFVHPNHG